MRGLQAGYLKAKTTAEIYQALKDDILSLKLRPGQLVSENEVAKLYHVSRTPVKNAFIRLEGEGLIEVVPQKGTFVTLIDCKHIYDVVYMRYVLEVKMFGKLLHSPSFDKIIGKMEENLSAQEEMIRSGTPSPSSFSELDISFHKLAFEDAGREHIWSIIKASEVHYPRLRLLETHITTHYDLLRNQHIGILEALRARDMPLLSERIYSHLLQYLSVLTDASSDKYQSYLLNWQNLLDNADY